MQDLAFLVGHRLLKRFINLGKPSLQSFRQLLPNGGQLQVPPGAGCQRNAKTGFQMPELVADGGLGLVKRLGGTAETAMAGNLKERL